MLRNFSCLVTAVLILALVSSCASTSAFDQSRVNEIEDQLATHLKTSPITVESLQSALSCPGTRKDIKVGVLLEQTKEIQRYPHAAELFYRESIAQLEPCFAGIEPLGIVGGSGETAKVMQRVKDSGVLDAVIVLSNMVPALYADDSWMNRRFQYNYEFVFMGGDGRYSKIMLAHQGEHASYDSTSLKIGLIKAIHNSALELAKSLQNMDKELAESLAEAKRKRAQLAEEEKKRAEEAKKRKELLAKLQEKQKQFLPYGFDILDFVNYAKTALRVKGGVDFGGAVPEIDFRSFKGKNYVEIKIDYLVTYNTLRVSMYEAASMTFDEIVKKLAKKISTDFKKQDDIAGFIFFVSYTNRDFLEKYDVPKYVTNEFILPKESCKKYASLDITNQDLINSSIVLVDGERISLNLQMSK